MNLLRFCALAAMIAVRFPGLAAAAAMTDRETIDAYLHGESKYHVLPVPAPLDPDEAEAVVIEHLAPPAPSEDSMAKLTRLALLHDLRGAAPAFAALLAVREETAADIRRTSWVLIALAMLGEPDLVARARQHFPEWLRRADVERDRAALVRATFYLVGEAPGQLRAAVTRALELRRAELARVVKSSPEAATLEQRIDALEEFAALDLRRLEANVALRLRVEALQAANERIAQLAAMYLRANPEAMPEAVEWAGFRLVREPEPAPVAAEFLTRAQNLAARPDPQNPEWSATMRARALRAARFFRGLPSEADLLWVARLRDSGADLLALRPGWEYPPPHQH